MSHPQPSPHGRAEILLALDNSGEAEQLKHALERCVHSVKVAANDNKTPETARSRKPTLIVSDIAMPGMDGDALCKRRGQKELQDAAVILISSLSGVEDVFTSLERAADVFVRRPYDEEAFLSPG